MLMLSNVLALALIVADEPKPSTAPAAMPKIARPRASGIDEPIEVEVKPASPATAGR